MPILRGKWHSLDARFFSRIRKTEKCWLWLGPKASYRGYGRLDHNHKRLLAHRIAYEKFKGPIPKQRPFVLHRCNNSSCVNPEHLYAGTKKDNAQDSIRAGTWQLRRQGADHPEAKFTWAQATEMRRLYVPYKFGFHRIAKMFKTHKSLVMQIVKNRSYVRNRQ